MRYPSAVDQRVPSGRRSNNRSIIVIVIALDLLLELVVLGLDLDLAAAVPELVLPLATTPAGAIAVRALDLFLVLAVVGFDLDPARPIPVLPLPFVILVAMVGRRRAQPGGGHCAQQPQGQHGLHTHLTTSALEDTGWALRLIAIRSKPPAYLAIRQRVRTALSAPRAEIGGGRRGGAADRPGNAVPDPVKVEWWCAVGRLAWMPAGLWRVAPPYQRQGGA